MHWHKLKLLLIGAMYSLIKSILLMYVIIHSDCYKKCMLTEIKLCKLLNINNVEFGLMY
jgi:hypothetical protein